MKGLLLCVCKSRLLSLHQRELERIIFVKPGSTKGAGRRLWRDDRVWMYSQKTYQIFWQGLVYFCACGGNVHLCTRFINTCSLIKSTFSTWFILPYKKTNMFFKKYTIRKFIASCTVFMKHTLHTQCIFISSLLEEFCASSKKWKQTKSVVQEKNLLQWPSTKNNLDNLSSRTQSFQIDSTAGSSYQTFTTWVISAQKHNSLFTHQFSCSVKVNNSQHVLIVLAFTKLCWGQRNQFKNQENQQARLSKRQPINPLT